jgi:uncharacterized protein (DUF1778 family)
LVAGWLTNPFREAFLACAVSLCGPAPFLLCPTLHPSIKKNQVTFATQATERNPQIVRPHVANDVPGKTSFESKETLLTQLRQNAPVPSPSGQIGLAPEKSKSTPEKLKRIELRATQEFMDVLDELAKKENLTRADIIRKGIALYARARIEASKGKLLGVISLKDGQIHTEEVFHV